MADYGYWQPHKGGGWEWHSGTNLPRGWGQWGYGSDTLKDHSKTPDGSTPQDIPPPPVNTTAKPTPHNGYWAPTRGGGQFTWMNTTQPVTVLVPGSYTYEQMTNPDVKPLHEGDGPPVDKDGKATKNSNPQYTGEFLAGDYNGDGKPDRNPYYVAPDVNAPKLTVQGGWPPDLDGTVPPPDPNAKKPEPGSPPPSHPAWYVDGSTIRTLESDIVSSATTAANEYQSLVNYVASTKWWIFSAGSPEALQVKSGHQTVTYDPNLKTTKDLSSASDNLLLNVADAIHSAGTFVEALNAAGQLYAHADLESFTPES
jgi:hypothetical protein